MLRTGKSFYLSSQNRVITQDESSSSDFYIKLDNIETLVEYDRCALMSATIPRSYYLIDTRHNTFILNENGTEYTITIEPGNYNVNNIRSTLTGLMNDVAGWTYTWSMNPVTGKLSCGVSGNAGVQPIITISDYRLAEILGFLTGDNVFTSDSYVGPNVVNFKLSNSVLIYCDIVAPDGLLQDISVNARDYASINWQQPSPLFSAKQFVLKPLVHVKLLDLENDLEPIFLNGLDWNFTLCFFKHNDFYEKYISERRITQGDMGQEEAPQDELV